ncbi:MAG: HdeD family acid-resistance protein [Patescibacteria group bacterium]|nr:HdeD family acid-resistance protein [Patescibacteria group bacterium]
MESNRQTNTTLGILLIVLGIIVLGAMVFTTLASVFLLGVALIIGGILEIAHGYYRERGGSTFYRILGGLINLVLGGILVFFPGASAITLTLIISLALVVLGIYRLYVGFSSVRNRGWNIAGGALTLLFGVLVFLGLPATGLFIIGLFLGLQLLISGVTLLLLGPSVSTVQIERGVSFAHDIRKETKKDRSKEKSEEKSDGEKY